MVDFVFLGLSVGVGGRVWVWVVWECGANGNFSIKSYYYSLSSNILEKFPSKQIWNSRAHLRACLRRTALWLIGVVGSRRSKNVIF